MHDASTALTQVADEVRKLGEAIGHENSDEFAQRTQAWADALGNAATNAASAANGIVLLTNEQIRSLRLINQEVADGTITLQAYEERMAEVFTGVSASLERQLDQLARLKETEQDLLDQIAQANGDDVEQEDARHKKALDDLKSEATTKDGFDQQAYNKLKALEDKLHAQKLKHIAEQQKAQDNANRNSGGGGAAPGPTSPTPSPSSPVPTPKSGVSIVINNPTFLSGRPKEADQFIRQIKKGLDELAMRS